jgi:hypothetical protein
MNTSFYSESIWNNPNSLDLLEMKKSSLIPTTLNHNSFLQILPSIRRLYTIFDSICPNIYRIYCSDSLRILNEILCLTDEYLHISSSSNELLSNEKSFDDFILKLRRPSLMRKKSFSLIKPELYCFGQGIQSYNSNNQLNQTILFCFELTTKNLSLPIDVFILDPNDNLVSTDIKYINTYNQGHTKLFSCNYTPITKSGIYKISFFYNNIKMINQQYSVFIHNSKKEQLLSSSSSEQLMKKPQQGKKTINNQHFLFYRYDYVFSPGMKIEYLT